MPKEKPIKVNGPQKIKISSAANSEIKQRQSIDVPQKSQNPNTPKPTGGSTPPTTGGSAIESLLISIGSVETKVFALGQRLSQAPYSQRSEIERQLGELNLQLKRLQQQLEDARKAELNKSTPNKPKFR